MTRRSTSWTKAAIAVCALFQILNVLNIVLLLVAAVHVVIDPDTINVSSGEPMSVCIFGMNLTLDNMSVYATDSLATVPGMVIYLLFGCTQAAMLFLAFGKIRNVVEYSQAQPPFRWENVEKLRQAGLLFLGTVGLELVFALVSMILAFGVLSFHVNLSFDNIIIGIIILCVSEIFAQSVRMQEDADGLV